MSKTGKIIKRLDWFKISILIIGLVGCFLAYKFAIEKNKDEMQRDLSPIIIAE